MLNVIALIFAGILVAGVAVALGSSNMGPSISIAAAEFQKLAPNYWHSAKGKISYNIIQAPSLIGPAWSPEQLPGGARPGHSAKKSAVHSLPRPVIQEPPQAFEGDLLELPADGSSEPAGLWADSPRQLGRVN